MSDTLERQAKIMASQVREVHPITDTIGEDGENKAPEPQEEAPVSRSAPLTVAEYLKTELSRLQAEFQDVVKKQAEEEQRHLLVRGRLEGLMSGIREDVTRVTKEIKAHEEVDETSPQ